VVEKCIGDAVMAAWGTPVATEGDAERAVRAVLDLVAAVAELGTGSGLPGLAARAGVVTGEVAVNLGAVGEGMVAGDAVNTASRVQAAAGPGSVLVDTPTQRLAASAIGFADAGERTLKGKAEPQRLWRAVRVVSAVGGSQRVDGLEAPLTGRDAELRTIKDLFHATAERRVPRLVLVSGPAGVGKSRLGWEFEKYADGLAADVWWHRGRCLSYGEGVAFWALAQIVRQRLGIAEEDPPETAAAKLAAGLDRFVPDPAEHAYAGLRLGRLLGVPFPGGSVAGDGGAALSREELFAGWRLFFERLAAESPVILLVEDLLAERRPQAIPYLRESARLATQTGDNFAVGRALLNLADTLMPGDPAAAADAARTAAGHLRRSGERHYLASAIINVAEALLQAGDWDDAETEFSQAVDSDALADIEELGCERGWLAALRGDAGAAAAILTTLRILRASEDPQDQAMIGLLEAFTAAARRQPASALRHARAILAHAEAVGISSVPARWAWPLAARCAHDLADTAAVRDLLALLDSYQPGYLAPMLLAERDLIRARLLAKDGDGDADAAASFAAAIKSLREQSTPYHLAHGLLDHAEFLLHSGDAGSDADLAAAASAIAEARDIAGRLRCQPLLDRAAALTPQDAPRVTS
jgi:AAA ATPase domain/Adenylate and Guanylate cyclase catalytic domain